MAHDPQERAASRSRWRIATPIAIGLSGVIFGVSAAQSEGTDLRGGRLSDLGSLVEAERERTEALTSEASALNAEIEALSARLGDRSVGRVQRQIRTLADPAGLTPRTGEAVQVTLDDATEEARRAWTGNPNDLVVHQQDIQAVVNAMWRAGASAVTVQGQRLVSTTGIKCEGNSVTLHGVPYAPPYVIVGVDAVGEVLVELDEDPILDLYREASQVPGGGVSWDVEYLPEATAPGFDGLVDLSWAEPVDA